MYAENQFNSSFQCISKLYALSRLLPHLLRIMQRSANYDSYSRKSGGKFFSPPFKFARHFMFYDSFKTLYWREFKSVRQGAEFFHVNVATVRRWLDGTVPINPMAEKLLIVKSLGYLPNDMRWRGFRVDEARAVLITPTGREFSPHELECFVYWRDEHKQMVEIHGHLDNVKHYPAKENVLPFRGGRRMTAAPWIPTKFK